MKADVTKKDEMERAFQKTVEKFGYIDILLNNAGIIDDRNWEKEVAINIVSLLHICNFLTNIIISCSRKLPQVKATYLD